ncbi:MAG TPA: hypothetical protein VJ941_00315, partial [Gracilimonas sp.]|nr:hypothetical protein [Gracilimonas sp.]
MFKLKLVPITVILAMILAGCITQKEETSMDIDDRLDQYTSFTLEADLSVLTENQKQMLPLLIDAAKEMEKVFWLQAYGDREELLSELNEKEQRFAEINYGPWDRLNGNEAFIEGVGSKPAGANFYPEDMLTAEFEDWDSEAKDDLYTLIRRDGDGNLITVPYHQAFASEHERAAELLRQAAELADDAGFKNYLELRADALLDDEYQESDLAWMDMKNNSIELVIGPIETYEDQLFGYKAAHEAFVLIKDKSWSERLSKYADVLPELQRGLPVPEEYKSETPGSDSDLNAYDAIYYAGDANAGSKTIA